MMVELATRDDLDPATASADRLAGERRQRSSSPPGRRSTGPIGWRGSSSRTHRGGGRGQDALAPRGSGFTSSASRTASRRGSTGSCHGCRDRLRRRGTVRFIRSPTRSTRRTAIRSRRSSSATRLRRVDRLTPDGGGGLLPLLGRSPSRCHRRPLRVAARHGEVRLHRAAWTPARDQRNGDNDERDALEARR